MEGEITGELGMVGATAFSVYRLLSVTEEALTYSFVVTTSDCLSLEIKPLKLGWRGMKHCHLIESYNNLEIDQGLKQVDASCS
ncbi:hypothetical protein AVEN_68361-1 [Araneus ventricosus]|uniref:Uncharacterized protein n=1 Tax=Araneus ventricosus TaxID=182803 RepID=A0A4Y2G001_ARAVE|nr:hypothetical protein AVEN_68361-1 [Araneus ventricosus]